MLGKIDRLSITQEIIDKGKCRDAMRCVIALALRSVWSGSLTLTNYSLIRKVGEPTDKSYRHDSTIDSFINDFDNGVKVKPCVLVVDHYLRRLSIEHGQT